MSVAREGPEPAKESLLGGVLGESPIARHPASGGQRRGGGQTREFGKGVLVAPAGAFDERRLVREVGGSRAGRASGRGGERPDPRQDPLPRKASNDLIAESAWLRTRSRNCWIFARCPSVKTGWISVRIFAKSTALSP